MPTPVVVLTGGADGTGFTTSSFATVSGDLYELTIFCASTVASPAVVDSEAVTWERLDDPDQFPNEPILRYSVRGSGGTITATFSFTGGGGAIGYVLARCPTVAGTTVANAYRLLSNGFRAQKGAPFTPGDNIPAAFADPDNVASVAFSGTQFGTWAGGTDWNGGVQPTPVQTALGLSNVTQVGRSQTNPNISVDLILAYGVDGSLAYGISWTSGPFTARGIYSEIIAGAGGGSAIQIDAAIEGVGAVSASATQAHRLTATASAEAAVAAETRLLHRIAATVAGSGVLTAAATQGHLVAAAVSGVGAVSATTNTSKEALPFDVKQLHSGHSLTDAGFHPWPGPWVYLLTEALGVSPFANVAKSTIPGSPLHYRWANETSLIPVSARYNIDEWEALIITEGVPLPNDGSSETHLALYAENAWENGNGGLGAPTLLFSTWTNIDGTDGPFRSTLDTYEPLWEQMADAATAALPPGAPPVFIIPGHRMMARFWDDIQAAATPAGIDNIADFFRDTIHLNDLGSYAWAMLHYACLYNTSPVGLPRDLWGPNQGWGDDNVEGPPAIPTLEQATYIQEAVWDVVTSYERTGVTGAAENVAVAGSVTGVGNVAAQVTQGHGIAAAVGAEGLVAAAVRQVHRITAAVAGNGALAATARVVSGLVATVTGVGGVAASTRQTHRVAGAVTGDGAVSASPRQTHRAAGVVTGVGNVSANILLPGDVAGEVVGVGVVAAVVRQVHRIAAAVSSVGTVSAEATVEAAGITAAVRGTGVVAAILRQTHRIAAIVTGRGRVAAVTVGAELLRAPTARRMTFGAARGGRTMRFS